MYLSDLCETMLYLQTKYSAKEAVKKAKKKKTANSIDKAAACVKDIKQEQAFPTAEKQAQNKSKSMDAIQMPHSFQQPGIIKFKVSNLINHNVYPI